jgi:hypothetical protein
VAVWCEEEAGPLQAVPQAGRRGQPEGPPATQPQAWIRGGTTQRMTLFALATGTLDLPPAASVTNTVLHRGLNKELDSQLARLPPALALSDPEANRAPGATWQEGVPIRGRLPAALPPLRTLRGWDKRAGQKTAQRGLWRCAPGSLPL